MTAMPKAVEAMRSVAVNVKRMLANVYMCACGVECKLRCQEVGECIVVNNISKTWQGLFELFITAADTKSLEFPISLSGARGNNEPTTVWRCVRARLV